MVIIEAAQIAKTVGQDYVEYAAKVCNDISEALLNAAAVVIDWRAAKPLSDFETYYFEMFMRQTLTGMLDTNVVLGSTRHRMHSGYATQTASSGASFYYSAMSSTAPQTIQAGVKINNAADRVHC